MRDVSARRNPVAARADVGLAGRSQFVRTTSLCCSFTVKLRLRGGQHPKRVFWLRLIQPTRFYSVNCAWDCSVLGDAIRRNAESPIEIFQLARKRLNSTSFNSLASAKTQDLSTRSQAPKLKIFQLARKSQNSRDTSALLEMLGGLGYCGAATASRV